MRTELDERRNYTMERYYSSYGPTIRGVGWGGVGTRSGRGVPRGVRQSHHNLLLISRRVYRPRDIRGAADVGVPLSVDIRIIKKPTPLPYFFLACKKGHMGCSD